MNSKSASGSRSSPESSSKQGYFITTKERVSEPRQHEYDFLEEPPPEYFCPVTFELLRDPKQTECCGHHLSGNVVTRLQQEGKPCPLCNDPNFTVISDKHFKRKVEELKVHCPHKRNGCAWEGQLGNLDPHSKSCPKRPWQCQHCGFRGTYDIGTSNHLPSCTKYPEPCPNQCDIGTVPCCDMEKHLAECPLQLVKCEFAQAGCQKKIPRQNLSRHMEEGVQRHLLNMSLLNLSLTRELHQKVAEKDQQIAELQGQLQEQSRKLEEQFQEIKGLQVLEKETETRVQQQLETQLTGFQSQIDGKVTDLHQQITGVQEQLEREITQQHKETKKQIVQMQRVVYLFAFVSVLLITICWQTNTQLQEQLAIGLTGLQNQIDENITNLHQKIQWQITEVQEQLERKVTEQHKKTEKQSVSGMQAGLQEDVLLTTLLQAGGMQALLQQFKQIPSSLQSVTDFIIRPPFEFILTKFSVRKTRGGNGGWYSDPFYSHPGGYKFLLNIDTNGHQDARGTHITAWLSPQPGEHHNELSWPIQVTAHLQLLNQRGDHDHVVASLNTRLNKGDTLYKEMARKFIAHSELEYNAAKDTQYLKDDCLWFRLYLKVTPQT